MSNNRPVEIDPSIEKPSRTKKKKAAQAVQKTGEQLLELSDAQLNSLQLPSELREAVADARNMTQHGARRRQLQYIGSLMRGIDTGQLKQDLERIGRQAADEARRFKQVEHWRDELKAGDAQRFEWLLDRFPAMNREELARLVEQAKQNKSEMEKRKAGRSLFRYLRQYADEG